VRVEQQLHENQIQPAAEFAPDFGHAAMVAAGSGTASACVVAAGIANAHMGVALVAILVATFTMGIVGPGGLVQRNDSSQESHHKLTAIRRVETKILTKRESQFHIVDGLLRCSLRVNDRAFQVRRPRRTGEGVRRKVYTATWDSSVKMEIPLE
jgi:hypothetical protein